MQARYYDPVLGRFYGNDPVGFAGHMSGTQGVQGFNRYAYVDNNPYSYTDPNGQEKFGLEINAKIVIKGGGVLKLGVMYDTDHHEIVLTGNIGVSSGGAAKGGIATVKPSSPEPIDGVVSGKADFDMKLSAEAGPLGGEVSLLTGEKSNSASAKFDGSNIELNGGIDLSATVEASGESKFSIPNAANSVKGAFNDAARSVDSAVKCLARSGPC